MRFVRIPRSELLRRLVNSGTPEDFNYLVDKAHELGLRVIIDVIHSHASKNTEDDLAGFDVGQKAEDSYFDIGEKGYHYLLGFSLV